MIPVTARCEACRGDSPEAFIPGGGSMLSIRPGARPRRARRRGGTPPDAGHAIRSGSRRSTVVRQIFTWFAQRARAADHCGSPQHADNPFSRPVDPARGKAQGGASSAVRVILKNEKYRGQWVWGRRLFFKDPLTGRRRARLRPSADWHVAKHEDLRIVPEDLWAGVEARFRNWKPSMRRVSRTDTSMVDSGGVLHAARRCSPDC
jgi:hypothetical protein